MAKYRKKPVVIEAVRWRGHYNNFGITEEAPDQPVEVTTENMHGIKWGVFPDWLPRPVRVADGTPPRVGEIFREGDDLLIYTLEGIMRAIPGDWIIRGVKGEIYPCRPDIFAATYEPAAGPEEGEKKNG